MASDTTRRSHHERFRQRAEQDYAVTASPEPGRELIHIAEAARLYRISNRSH
jgi:hypothetical protein